MGPKPKNSVASKPQKRTWKPSSKVLECAHVNSSDKENASTQPAKVCHTSWTTARTECLLDWLDENPADRQKLFSDSTKDAKDEGQRKCIAKGTKSEFHKLITTLVFSVDADKEVQKHFAANSGNYMKSVNHYLGQ